MLRDARRYLPALGHARIVESLFEVKTVLVRNGATWTKEPQGFQ